jgi:trehalose/maltose hydrolase-like predicted phosphorylase
MYNSSEVSNEEEIQEGDQYSQGSDHSDEVGSSPLQKISKMTSRALFKKEEQRASMMFMPVVQNEEVEGINLQEKTTDEKEDSSDERDGVSKTNKKKRKSEKNSPQKTSKKQRPSVPDVVVDASALETENSNYSSLYLEQCSSWFRRETRKSNASVTFTEDTSDDEGPRRRCSLI